MNEFGPPLEANTKWVMCAEGMGSLVTGWGRVGGEVEGRGRKWVRRGRMSSWEGEQWISAEKK
jgi:hypothetical protein